MELPTYSVSQSLLSSRPVAPTRGDYPLRSSPNEIDGPDPRGTKVIGKRKRTTPGYASLESGSRPIGLPQYAVPESLSSSQTVYHSPGEQAFRAPPTVIQDSDRHRNSATTSQLGGSIPVHSRPELALGTPRESQSHSPHSTLTSSKQSHEQLHAVRTPSCHFLNEIPNLAFQADKDDGGKHNCFLDATFFPSPTITDAWGEIPAPDLSWDPASKGPSSISKTISTAETDTTMVEARERSEFDSGRSAKDVHGTPSTNGFQLATSESIEARLSQVLKAVDAAGFDSLDSAVIAYYQKSPKDSEWLRQEQRLNRMRRLPALLKELHLSAQGWGQWERRNFQEQIIKSTEEILFAELENHLAARRTYPQNSPCTTSTEDETDVEAELPNTWTLMTSLSTKYSTIASQDWQTDMPKLVGKFLAAGTEL